MKDQMKDHDVSKRNFLKTTAYVTPAILTMAVAPSFAMAGSGSPLGSDKEDDHGTNQENNHGSDEGGGNGYSGGEIGETLPVKKSKKRLKKLRLKMRKAKMRRARKRRAKKQLARR
ncbi:MAG: hypothetical protein ACREVH_12410 [Gammaproteobacteria bacterium]